MASSRPKWPRLLEPPNLTLSLVVQNHERTAERFFQIVVGLQDRVAVNETANNFSRADTARPAIGRGVADLVVLDRHQPYGASRGSDLERVAGAASRHGHEDTYARLRE